MLSQFKESDTTSTSDEEIEQKWIKVNSSDVKGLPRESVSLRKLVLEKTNPGRGRKG